MDRFRRRARRMPVLLLCLALFTVSSNYCLLSAWGGNSSMACMALPKANSAPSCHHCASPGPQPRHGKAPSGRSCCPAPVVAPSSVSVEKHDAGVILASASFLVVTPDPSPLFSVAAHGRHVLKDGRPPTRFARAPLSPRAPPLA